MKRILYVTSGLRGDLNRQRVVSECDVLERHAGGAVEIACVHGPDQRFRRQSVGADDDPGLAGIGGAGLELVVVVGVVRGDSVQDLRRRPPPAVRPGRCPTSARCSPGDRRRRCSRSRGRCRPRRTGPPFTPTMSSAVRAHWKLGWLIWTSMGWPVFSCWASTALTLFCRMSAMVGPPCGGITSRRLMALRWAFSVISSAWISRNCPGCSKRQRNSDSGLSRTCGLALFVLAGFDPAIRESGDVLVEGGLLLVRHRHPPLSLRQTVVVGQGQEMVAVVLVPLRRPSRGNRRRRSRRCGCAGCPSTTAARHDRPRQGLRPMPGSLRSDRWMTASTEISSDDLLDSFMALHLDLIPRLRRLQASASAVLRPTVSAGDEPLGVEDLVLDLVADLGILDQILLGVFAALAEADACRS